MVAAHAKMIATMLSTMPYGQKLFLAIFYLFIKESEARFDEKFDLKFEPEFKGLQGKFKFLLTPKNGEISSLGYEILLTRPQTNKDNKDLNASWQENELVSESVSLKEGRWQLLLRLNDKQDTRYYKFDFNATK